mmetsp:Transcript_17882/g.25771  ORF Transcript_17882/g.25771 Transcript_17882/m.25771 type:complete len:101 (+) Transcript_17882:3-305(+)
MVYYINQMIDDFKYELTGQVKQPWTEKLMKIDRKAKKLDEERKKIFHTFVIKAMFLSKRGRPDINLAVKFLSSRVREPNKGDWNKLIRILNFLKIRERTS